MGLSFTFPSFGRLSLLRSCETKKRLVSAPRMTKLVSNTKTLSKPSVIFITPNNVCQNIGATLQLVKAVLCGGVSLVQVRDMNSTTPQVKQLIQALLAGGVPAHTLAINGMDPHEVVGIDRQLGVHIKERDIGKLLPEAKEVMPRGSVIGCAVHSTQAARQVKDIHEPSYLQVGTMYSTQSHPGKIPEGPRLVKEIRNVVGKATMLIGVGGINEDNLASVIDHDADGVAVITELSNANDPQMKAASLLKLCQTAFETKKCREK
ncbi:Thiamine monophosphate synthase [Gracilaria domingensis]|nr:Thiamine monophosphate synthase [Gracilaria domingensis]